MRIIAIINQKGGCGKTTTSINLAACMARLGQKTLLVDMDPQGHCGIGLAVPEVQIERTIYDALIEESDGKTAKVSEMVWQIASDFDLAPSSLKLSAFEQVFAGRPGREDRLAKALEPVRPNYNWVILDCPPSVGLITFNALRACDEVIVPVETGFFSLHGLTKMMETLEMLKEKCSKDILIRVLPTLYDTRTKLAREVLSELRSKFRDYLMESTINFNTKLKEAASFGQPITEYDPGSRGYKDFVNLARELMGHRPVDVEPSPNERLSRPAELVQRARHLAQLTNYQFGKNSVPTTVPNLTGSGNGFSNSNGFSNGNNGGNSNGGGYGNGNGNANGSGGGTIVAPPPMTGVEASLKMGVVATASAPRAGLDFGSPMMAHQSMNSQPIMEVAKTTSQKLEEFYGVKQIGDEVVFSVKLDHARKVLIAGDFNNWIPFSTPMQRMGRPGEWRTRLPLTRGRYRYRLVVDGNWITDPNNQYVETNQYGELNNVVEVE